MATVDLEVANVNEVEVRKALKRMRSGKTDLMIYLWRYDSV